MRAAASFDGLRVTEQVRHELPGLVRAERLQRGSMRRSASRHPSRGAPRAARAAPMHSRTTGASRARSATCSTRSRKVGSAHWRSSITITSGRSRASASNRRRTAQKISSLVAAGRAAETDAYPPARRRSARPSARRRAERRWLRGRSPPERPPPRRSDLADDLRERPVRDALAVGQAAAAQDARAPAEPVDEVVPRGATSRRPRPRARSPDGTRGRPPPRPRRSTAPRSAGHAPRAGSRACAGAQRSRAAQARDSRGRPVPRRRSRAPAGAWHRRSGSRRRPPPPPGASPRSPRARWRGDGPGAGGSAITSPVPSPMRVVSRTPNASSSSSARPGSISWNSTAARSARSASSSWSTGTPNTAISASPGYASTVPPCLSNTARMSPR